MHWYYILIFIWNSDLYVSIPVITVNILIKIENIENSSQMIRIKQKTVTTSQRRHRIAYHLVSDFPKDETNTRLKVQKVYKLIVTFHCSSHRKVRFVVDEQNTDFSFLTRPRPSPPKGLKSLNSTDCLRVWTLNFQIPLLI